MTGDNSLVEGEYKGRQSNVVLTSQGESLFCTEAQGNFSTTKR
jgi:hypothetical protein